MLDRFGDWFTLLVLGGAQVDTAPLLQAATDLGIPLEIVHLPNPAVRELYERDLILVRPDRHVAWRGDAFPVDILSLMRQVTGGTVNPA